MKLFIISTTFFLSYTHLPGQEMSFALEQPKLCCIDEIEKKEGGRELKTEIVFKIPVDYFPGSSNFNFGQPVIYSRPASAFQPEIHYYYSVPDSIVRLAQYTWEGNEHQAEVLKRRYEKNAAFLSEAFGKQGDAKKIQHDGWTETSVTWEDSEKYTRQYLVTGSGTYRLRVLITWK